MDRLPCSIAAIGLGLLLVAPGCRSTRPEVPPSRPYSDDGRQRAPIAFSSEGHPMNGAATARLTPDTAGNTKLADGVGAGTGRPDVGGLLGGAEGSFGPPGTSGRGESAGKVATGLPDARVPDDEAVLPAGAPRLPRQSIDPYPSPVQATPATDPAAAPPPAAEMPAEVAAPPGQAVVPELEGAGRMGSGNDLPSPN